MLIRLLSGLHFYCTILVEMKDYFNLNFIIINLGILKKRLICKMRLIKMSRMNFLSTSKYSSSAFSAKEKEALEVPSFNTDILRPGLISAAEY